MKSYKLGDLFTKRSEKGIPGLPIASVTLDRGLVPRSSLDRRTESNLSPEQHLLARKGDIVYNMMRMWQGASGMATEDCLISPAYVVCAPNYDLIDSEFMAFLFKSSNMINKFHLSSRGLTEDRLRLYYDDFSKIKLKIPSIREQKKISQMLSCWDRAIAEANLISEKFGLVLRYYSAQCEKIVKKSASEAPLSEVCELLIGGTPSRNNPNYWCDPIDPAARSWLSIRDLKGKYISTTKETITMEATSKSNVKLLPEGTPVVSFKLSLGKRAILQKPMYTNEAICGVIPKNIELINPKYLYHALGWIDYESKVDQAIKGKTLNKEKLGEFLIKFPDMEAQIRIAKFLDLVEAQQEITERLSNSYALQKQALMQQLFAGKIKVS